MKRPVYLDAHATTPVDPRVVERMLPYFTERFGNAASRNHAFGWEAEEAVEEAREQAAAAIAASPKEIVWTSGATESDNLAVLGATSAARDRGDHIVTAVTEHPAVLDPVQELERRGRRVTRLPVDSTGLVDPAELRAALDDRTVLVSIMLANNEVGTVQPIAELARIVHEHSGALFHTDAVQAVGKMAVDVEAMGVDLLSGSAHKIHGPKGAGFLYVRRRRPTVRLDPLLFGGGQERGVRSGTLNVPGIVGMGTAMELAAAEWPTDAPRLRALRDELLGTLQREIPGVHLNGHPTARLPNNLNVSFEGVESEDLLREMPGLAVSSGAACSSASLDPSHVITALGHSDSRAQSSLRLGLHRFTTAQDTAFAAQEIVRAVKRLRSGAAAERP